MKLPAEVREALRIPRIARFCVTDRNGYPHCVPLWFDVDGDDIVMISPRETRKVDYVRASPQSSICIGGGEDERQVLGNAYLLKGTSVVEDDPDYRFLRQLTYRYDPDRASAEKNIALWRETYDMMVIRLNVEKIIQVYP
jgi:Pyridoxamine 5'-phosphate oxidase